MITFTITTLGPGRIDVLETAWNDNPAHAAIVLQPADRRFVYARAHRILGRRTTIKLRASINRRGRRLVRHHTYAVTLRLWVSFTPVHGLPLTKGYRGLQLPK